LLVNAQASTLRIRRSIYQGDITRPKTTHSERVVDVPPRIVTMLNEYKEDYPPLKGDYIFRTDSGAPIDGDNWFGRYFVPTAVKAKLRPEKPNPNDEEQLVGLHTLRHTYASILINQGESIKYVSKQMGHASIQITADLYGHLFKETSVSAMNRLKMRIPVVQRQRTGTEG
jgi:integrase